MSDTAPPNQEAATMATLLTALRATIAYLVHSVICRLLGGSRPQPPAAPDYSAL
jgi:hypothetical protein